jgi:mannonate dehydratase
MRQTWRWFGPADQVTLNDMLQAGVEGVVSALHHVPTGDVWTAAEIAQRQNEISRQADNVPSGLNWEVVESLPVSEDIKKQQGEWRTHIANYKQSLRNLSAAGIGIVCYNFMPVLDWTRTDIAFRLPNGATCMRFDLTDFVVFDVYILKRAGAIEDYSEELLDAAAKRYAVMDNDAKDSIASNVVYGLPGAAESFSLEDVRQHIGEYSTLSEDGLRNNLIAFLEHVAPLAQELGIKLCCHPDDPPFPLLGLPRIMSTEAQYRAILEAVDLPANGITLCSGSLGARPDNDLTGMMTRLGERVHFLHLRNVTRESDEVRGSFHEAEHLNGDTDMVPLVQAVLDEETRRREAGRSDSSIPFRPDHGQDILDDLSRKAQPGYPAIGRLKGLAELRGIMTALSHANRTALGQAKD